MTARPKRIVITGGDADGNLGDRAILQAMCQELRSLDPDLVISAVAEKETAAAAGVECIARGLRGLPRLISAAFRADVVLCGGGGLFQDDDSLVKMPYWAARVALLRICCPRIVGYSLGVGPLTAASSRAAARIAFFLMSDISVRDPIARKTAQTLTHKPVAVVPDPAPVLRPASADEATALLDAHGVPLDGRPIVGVTVRRWFPPKPRLIPNKISSRLGVTDRARNESSSVMCTLLADVLDRVVSETNAFVLFLPTYNVPHEGDDRLCREISEKMSSGQSAILCIDDVGLYMAVCDRLDAMIGGRMHPTLLAASVGTPVVGLSYNPKFQGAFSMHGMSDRLMDIGDFVLGEKVDELHRLVKATLHSDARSTLQTEALRSQIREFNERLLRAGR